LIVFIDGELERLEGDRLFLRQKVTGLGEFRTVELTEARAFYACVLQGGKTSCGTAPSSPGLQPGQSVCAIAYLKGGSFQAAKVFVNARCTFRAAL
jgi:hypothetical protein